MQKQDHQWRMGSGKAGFVGEFYRSLVSEKIMKCFIGIQKR